MRYVRPLIGLLISLALVGLLLRTVDPGTLVGSLRAADYTLLAPAVLVFFVGIWFRSARWQVMLQPLVALRTRQLFRAMIIGYELVEEKTASGEARS